MSDQPNIQRKGALPRPPIQAYIPPHVPGQEESSKYPRLGNHARSVSEIKEKVQISEDCPSSSNSSSKKKTYFSYRNRKYKEENDKEADRRQTFDPKFVFQTRREDNELYALVVTLQEQLLQPNGALTRKHNHMKSQQRAPKTLIIKSERSNSESLAGDPNNT
ncbi:hypothetical protein K3495_g5667 [Podosphaera aphanis]|nr:hypothetical protein K3495_g5667 [Podosphaera aphanis]